MLQQKMPSYFAVAVNDFPQKTVPDLFLYHEGLRQFQFVWTQLIP